MRAKKSLIALAAVCGLMGSLTTQAFAQVRPLPQPQLEILRVDYAYISLVKVPSGGTLDQVLDLYDGAVIMAKCYTSDSCLKARQIAEPLADLVLDGLFNIAIIESAGEVNRNSQDIVYMFGDKRCGYEMAPGDYTTLGLLEAATQWASRLPKACLAK